MSARLSHKGLPEGVGRFDLLRDFRLIAKSVYNLSSTALTLLTHLIERTQDDDYGPDRICAYWGKNSRITEECPLSVRSINYAANELQRRGFIIRTTGPNGMRGGKRNAEGIIEWAAGLNLQPWIDKWEEIRAEADAHRLRIEAINALRREIRCMGQQLRSSGDPHDRDTAQTILPDNRTARISEIEKLDAIRSALVDALHAVGRSDRRAQKSSDASEENCAPSIQKKSEKRYCRRRVPHAAAPHFTPGTVVAIASETYRSLLPRNRKSGWQDVIDASFQISRYLGIKDKVWVKSCEMFGKEQTALCIAIIDSNHALPFNDRYHARQPSLCLEGMTRKASRGELDIARLIGPLLMRMDSRE